MKLSSNYGLKAVHGERIGSLQAVVYCGWFSNIHTTPVPLGNSNAFWGLTLRGSPDWPMNFPISLAIWLNYSQWDMKEEQLEASGRFFVALKRIMAAILTCQPWMRKNVPDYQSLTNFKGTFQFQKWNWKASPLVTLVCLNSTLHGLVNLRCVFCYLVDSFPVLRAPQFLQKRAIHVYFS